MTRLEIINEYFEWLLDAVYGDRYTTHNSYRELLTYLHKVDFVCAHRRDQDRASDGIDLRRRFSLEYDFNDIPSCLYGPCSVLEMMIALAIRCEETIMGDVEYGDRTGQWFWRMLTSLGLDHMTDSRFDLDDAEFIIDRFLNREYEPDGRGGLFSISDCPVDLRNIEIWIQMLWYLDEYYVN